ncbi:hypothetical protein [Streptomyces sp. NPDC054783]
MSLRPANDPPSANPAFRLASSSVSITVTVTLPCSEPGPGDADGDLQLPPILARRGTPCHSTVLHIVIMQVNALRDPTRRVGAEV